MERKNDKYQDLRELFEKEFTKKIELIIERDEIKQGHREVMTEKKEQLANRVLYSPNLSELDEDLSDLSIDKLDELRKKYYTTDYDSKEFEAYSELEEMYLQQVEIEGIRAEMDKIEAELQQSLQNSIDQTRSFQKNIEDKIKENDANIAKKEAEISKLRRLDEERIDNGEAPNNENLIDELLLDVEYLKIGNADLQKRSDIAEDFLTKYGSLEALREAIKTKELREEENIKNSYLYDEKKREFGYFDDWNGNSTEPKVTESKPTEPKVEEPKVEEPKVEEPKVTEPKVTEPKVTEPKVTEPKVTGPKVTRPKVTGPKAAGPKAAGPKVTGPKVTEPKVTEPKVAKTNATETRTAETNATEPRVGITNNKKLEGIQVIVCPIANNIYLYADGKDGEKELISYQPINYTKEYMYGEGIKKIVDRIQEELGEDLQNFDKIDPNVLMLLDRIGCNKQLQEYVCAIEYGKKTSLYTFELKYDLKDMYKSDMLYDEEKRNVNRLANNARRIGIIPKPAKDNFVIQLVDNIKALVGKEKRKQLVDKNKADEMQTQREIKEANISNAYEIAKSKSREAFVKEVESKLLEGESLTVEQKSEVGKVFDEKYDYRAGKFVPKIQSQEAESAEHVVAEGKENIDEIIEEVNSFEDDDTRTVSCDVDSIINEVHSWEKENKATEEKDDKSTSRFISRAKSIAVSIGKGYINMGNKIFERFRGKTQGVTENDKQHTSNERTGFIPRVTDIDHAKAQNAADTKANDKKVIIEHPDGRKEEGTRL